MKRHSLALAAVLLTLVSAPLFAADPAPAKPADAPASQPALKPAAADGSYSMPTMKELKAWQGLIAPVGAGGTYSLDQFGSVGDGKAAQAAFDAAEKHIIAAGGGVLMIPIETDWNWKPKNTGQRELRTPLPPAPTKGWREGVGMTVVDLRGNHPTVYPSGITGMTVRRVLDLRDGDSLPHWNYNPMLDLQNVVAFGSTSYHDWIQNDTEGGPDTKLQVATIRGLFPGMFITANAWSSIQRLCVKSLGYDKADHCWYIVADTTGPIKKGTILSNKNHVNVVKMETFSHNENQTFDLCLWRHNYSQGDNYLIDARFKYTGDVHSTAGDENGVIFAGFVEGHVDAFGGKVESWDPQTGELRFTAGGKADTLGSGRPIININPSKSITAGNAWIVAPASYTDDSKESPENAVFQGKSYPTRVVPNKLGNTSLRVGGLIRLSKEAPVTADCVGRYFAVNQDDEFPKNSKVRRWYLIDSVVVNADGTKDIRIIRHWWGAKSAGSPTLYNPDNYSHEGHEVALKYIIAPGANAYDVSDALPNVGKGNMLKLAPTPFTGTDVDFAKGDPVEQAIGSDPFHPQIMRSWTWDKVPSMFPACYLDLANFGDVQRHTVMRARGGSGDIAVDAKTWWNHTTTFDRILDFQGTSQNAIVFDADVANAALQFKQPHGRAQPVVWQYGMIPPVDPNAATAPAVDADGKPVKPEKPKLLPAKITSLTVSPDSGVMTLDAPAVAVPGGITKAGGLSGGEKPASNLRGINVAVKAGSKELAVKFAKPELDAEYAVFVELTWPTVRTIVTQTAEGFTVKFEAAPPADAKLHWMIVR
ncbi:MAG: hypothetical protein NTW19_18255 [Planctomycetota bacterium]|nr:hypothetical protein [Planctomycetota bacterium]